MSQLAPYLYMSGNPADFEVLKSMKDPADLGALKYTTNKFYRITGSSTQLKGVVPDIVLPSSYDYMETEEAREENVMPWDEIQGTPYDKLNMVQPFLPELEKRSAKRVAASKDFAYVREDIGLVKKTMSDKSASLNEGQRLKESAEAESRKKERDAEMKARKEPSVKIFDLTLKNGDVLMTEEKKTNSPLASIDPKAKSENAESSPGAANADGTSTLVENPDSSSTLSEPDSPSPEEKAPLEEAENILMDYISLLHSHADLTAEQQPKASSQ
jgi:carboxyl-terminal processing protease